MKQLFCYRCDKNTVHLATSLAFMRVRHAGDNTHGGKWDRGGPAWVCSGCGEVVRALPAEQIDWLRAWFSDAPGVDTWGKLKEPMPQIRRPNMVDQAYKDAEEWSAPSGSTVLVKRTGAEATFVRVPGSLPLQRNLLYIQSYPGWKRDDVVQIGGLGKRNGDYKVMGTRDGELQLMRVKEGSD